MATTILKAKSQFSAWGKDYVPGQPIPAADYEAWPEGDLGRRLEGKDVEFATVSEDQLAEDAFPPAEE